MNFLQKEGANIVISVYESEKKPFFNNGIKILKPLKALIYKQDNADYYLDLKDSINNLEYYQSGNILRLGANSALESEMFVPKTIK